METKELNLQARKNSRTMSTGYRYSLDLLVPWLREIGVDPEHRRLKLEFDGEKIVFTKAENELTRSK